MNVNVQRNGKCPFYRAPKLSVRSCLASPQMIPTQTLVDIHPRLPASRLKPHCGSVRQAWHYEGHSTRTSRRSRGAQQNDRLWHRACTRNGAPRTAP